MKADKQSRLVPKLRFPEFREEWQPATVGDLFDSKNERERATTFDSNRILTVKLHANGVVKNERTGTLSGGASYFKRRAGQFIFSKIDLLNGAFGIVPEELDGFYSSSDVPAFSFGTKHSPAFFLNWLTANYRRLEIERTGTSATLKRVSPEKFHALPILLASLAEQQKIADCLGSLDDLIAAEGRKLEALRRHKQGLMQQLFPQPGETVPQLRFPEFEDMWNETNLQEECQSIASGKDKIDSYGEFDLYGSTGVIGKTSHGTYEGRFLLVARVGANAGRLTVATGQFGVTDNTLILVLKNPSKIDFISQYLENYGLNKMIFGSGQPLITGGQLKALPLYLPSEEEQQKIASSLTSLDDRIAAQARRIEALKAHKQGLLQQLFPSPEGNE